MDKAALLAHLRALLEREPNWTEFSHVSREHKEWIGQTLALINRWDKFATPQIKVALMRIGSNMLRADAVGTILQTIQNAIADLELEVPPGGEVIFGPGDVYDFFRRLNQIINSAEVSILVVDPYMDDTIFDHYLHARPKNVTVRLLCDRYGTSNSAAAQKYNTQHGPVVEVRRSDRTHDRVVFIDEYVCFVIGQSLKDAAKAMPTYISPLPPDVVPKKFQLYEQVWQSATVI